MTKRKAVLLLFLTFFKIGAFTFGGGSAMIALMRAEFVERKGWLTSDEFLDMIAIAESTPGPIAINSSTYIGYKVAGVLGSIFGTLGVCLPSFAIIYVISLFFDRFLSLTFVGYAFMGIRACVLYLILTAGIGMIKSIKKNWFSLSVLIVSFCLLVAFTLFAVNFSSVFFILIGGALGVAVYGVSLLREKGKEEKK